MSRVVEVDVQPADSPGGVRRSVDVILLDGQAGAHRIEVRGDGTVAVVQVDPVDVAWTTIIAPGDTIIVIDGTDRSTFQLPQATPTN